MSAPTPSDAAITTLLRGEHLALSSGKVIVEKLGAHAKRLLHLLWSNRVELMNRKTAEQATHLRTLYSNATTLTDEAPAAAPAPPTGAAGPRWRLHHLRCQSIRGIAPFGEAFEFSIGGESTLIYGPNGTGKSSLVNAIAWVFTGKVMTDCETDAEHIALYSPPKAGGRSTKLCDWPVINTLPHGSDPKRVKPDCTAEVILKSADGSKTLHLRRTGSLLEGNDGSGWRPCPDLSVHGITPLDVQLSISAPTVFGRRSLESSPDTRHLLSMMLGYDAIEELGSLVTGVAPALTKAANAEGEEVGEKKRRLQEKLQALPGSLRDGHSLLSSLRTLTGATLPTPERISEVRGFAVEAAAKAEAELAGALGLDASGKVPAGLAEAAASALVSLSRPWAELFPALANIGSVVPELSGESGPWADTTVAEKLGAFERTTGAKIAARLSWWRQEVAPGSRAALLIQAATYYEPGDHNCPVCEQSVLGFAVETRLADLKGSAAELRSELRVFFRDLIDEVEQIVPAGLRSLAAADPAAAIKDGWEQLKRTLGPSLAGVTARYEAEVAELSNFTVPIPVHERTLVPEGTEDAFRENAAGLEKAVREAWRAIAVAAWAAAHILPLAERVRLVLTSPNAEPSSLYATLAKGRQAAADIAPVATLHDELAAAATEATAIATVEAGFVLLGEVRAALEEIKNVGKFAEAEVEHVFGGIRDDTIEHFGKLYPHANPDLVLTRLHLNKGRDKSVEPYLAAGGFEFPGQQVANAGCIRAVALAFYFSLLGKHPGGLGFVVMDDPILSLDENHREAWSSNVLRPCLATTQIILATHQRQFLNNCRSDFRPGRLVELNPRTRSRQITWRPGDRLENAERMTKTDWNSAPVEMRKYREELLITLDAYSPTQFFTRKQLKDSLDRYAALDLPNPLAGANEKIAARLRDEKVTRVLDPGSHAMTEADVTGPMVLTCLRELLDVDGMFRKELDRLEELRLRELRSKSIPAQPTLPADEEPDSSPTTIPVEMLRVGDDLAWRDPLALKVIGMAAAQTRGCVVDMSELPQDALFPPGGAVLVVGDGLAPLARSRQWALLADPSVRVRDGDYAAVADQAGNQYLRRIWSADDAWLLEAINPLAALGPVRVRKCACATRKVIGIAYGNAKDPKLGKTRLTKEWHPRRDFPASPLAGLYGVKIRGTSLEPLAGDGQVVVVGEKLGSRFDSIPTGSIAVIETEDPLVGHVIKRVYPGDRMWLLLSPNPIDPREPLTVLKKQIRAVWPVRGVLFELSISDS